MLRNKLRALVMAGAFMGVFIPTMFADIVIITVGEKTGDILDHKKIPDGKTEITVEIIKVPGK